MPNICFNYLYRDAGNYKQWGAIIFSNPEEYTLQKTLTLLTSAFLPDGIFSARQVRIPELFMYSRGNATSDDHCFHEFYSIEFTTKPASDIHSRSIAEFLVEVSAAAHQGWDVFDPDVGLEQHSSRSQ
jgi:hypothetical protein